MVVNKTTPGFSYESPIMHDLPHLARLAMGMKPVWSHQGEDLNLNLISCTAGQGVDRLLNTEVDVVILALTVMDPSSSTVSGTPWVPVRWSSCQRQRSVRHAAMAIISPISPAIGADPVCGQ